MSYYNFGGYATDTGHPKSQESRKIENKTCDKCGCQFDADVTKEIVCPKCGNDRFFENLV